MSRISLGILLGLGAAIVATLVMLPLAFPTPADKKRAIAAAFLNRFELGFIVANVSLPPPSPVAGAVLGLGISASSAVISRTYAPILVMGTAMGALCGWIASAVG